MTLSAPKRNASVAVVGAGDYIGGEIAQSSLGLPSAAIQAFQGMLLFFLLALDVLTNFKLKFASAGSRP